MFLVDVSRDYYIDINLYNTGTIKMVFIQLATSSSSTQLVPSL